MPEHHTRPRLLERQRDVEGSLRRLGYFKNHDPANLDAVLTEQSLQGATIDWQKRVIYYPWVNGYLQITDDGVTAT